MDEILQAPVEVGRSSGYPPRPTNSLTVESEVFFFFRGPALHKNEEIIKLNLAQVRLLEADFKVSVPWFPETLTPTIFLDGLYITRLWVSF